MTMRRGHHTSGVLRAMGTGIDDPAETSLDAAEDISAIAPE
jgi:hypothetical protein